MDTVIRLPKTTRCVLKLYLRPCRLQVCLLLPDKMSSAVAAALNMLEKKIRKPLFQRLLDLILIDEGPLNARPSIRRPEPKCTTVTYASPNKREDASETT